MRWRYRFAQPTAHSLLPGATVSAYLVDEGGYPRAGQRFLRGWRASSSRDAKLPVEGQVTKVIHSADGHCWPVRSRLWT
jgi:hypothetical protein